MYSWVGAFNMARVVAILMGLDDVPAQQVPLLAGNSWGTDMRVQGFACGPDTDCGSRYNQVGAAYFTTVGMQMVDGRMLFQLRAAAIKKAGSDLRFAY